MRITDINDNTPVFTEPTGYNFAVNEGKAGLTVGVVTVNHHSVSSLTFLQTLQKGSD